MTLSFIACTLRSFVSELVVFLLLDFLQVKSRRVVLLVHTEPLSRAVQPVQVSGAHRFTSTTVQRQTCEFNKFNTFLVSLHQLSFIFTFTRLWIRGSGQVSVFTNDLKQNAQSSWLKSGKFLYQSTTENSPQQWEAVSGNWFRSFLWIYWQWQHLQC